MHHRWLLICRIFKWLAHLLLAGGHQWIQHLNVFAASKYFHDFFLVKMLVIWQALLLLAIAVANWALLSGLSCTSRICPCVSLLIEFSSLFGSWSWLGGRSASKTGACLSHGLRACASIGLRKLRRSPLLGIEAGRTFLKMMDGVQAWFGGGEIFLSGHHVGALAYVAREVDRLGISAAELRLAWNLRLRLRTLKRPWRWPELRTTYRRNAPRRRNLVQRLGLCLRAATRNQQPRRSQRTFCFSHSSNRRIS